jgi:hypothetical protein
MTPTPKGAPKKKSLVTYINPGPFPVYLGLITSENVYLDEMKRLKVDRFEHWCPGSGRCYALEGDDGNGLIVLIVLNKPTIKALPVDERMNVCVHEAVHAYQYIRDYIEERSPGAEMEAYTIAWIAQQAFLTLTNGKRT